jgi:hypothetical protein
MLDDEYRADDEEDEKDHSMNLIEHEDDLKPPIDGNFERVEVQSATVKEEVDPAFASWFKVEPDKTPALPMNSETESDTDPESGGDDAHAGDDWTHVEAGPPDSDVEEDPVPNPAPILISVSTLRENQ